MKHLMFENDYPNTKLDRLKEIVVSFINKFRCLSFFYGVTVSQNFSHYLKNGTSKIEDLDFSKCIETANSLINIKIKTIMDIAHGNLDDWHKDSNKQQPILTDPFLNESSSISKNYVEPINNDPVEIIEVLKGKIEFDGNSQENR